MKWKQGRLDKLKMCFWHTKSSILHIVSFDIQAMMDQNMSLVNY